MIVNGTFKNGFEYEYDDIVFHYWKLLKLVKGMKSDDQPEAFYDYCLLILGQEQLDELEAYIEKTTGRPAMIEDFSAIAEEIAATASEQVKNS